MPGSTRLASGPDSRPRPWMALVLASATLLPGCSEELGPEKFVTTSVSGRVISLGKPVESGWVEIIPVDGTQGILRTTRIAPDGTFKAEKVPVGKVAVALARLPFPSVLTPSGTIPVRVFQFSNTPIRRTIPAQPDAPIEIDLGVEAYRYYQEQAALKKVREESGR